jgi:2'-5' RNA ligase
MEKHDYTYVCLLDEKTTQQIHAIQDSLAAEFGHSDFTDHWNPHVTISFGNLLSQEEESAVIAKCAEIAEETSPFTIHIHNVVIAKKEVQGFTYYALRLKVAPSDTLDMLSKKVTTMAHKYEVPFDAFSEDHYHVGLGRYSSPTLSQEKIDQIISLENFSDITVNSFSLFYSMFNTPTPPRAQEIQTFQFGK